MSMEPTTTSAPAAAPQMVCVPQELAQELLGYLQTKPFNEVAGIIGKLAQCRMGPVTFVDAPPPAPASVVA